MYNKYVGYTAVAWEPASGDLKVSSTEQSLAKIYYQRDLSTKWQFAEYQETLASAQDRAAGRSETPVYELITDPPIDKYDPTDSVQPLDSEAIKTKYSAAGFTYSGASLGTPTTPAPEDGVTEITVKGDGTARGNVYYMRNINAQVTVEYYTRNVGDSGFTKLDDETVVKTGLVAGITVYTEKDAGESTDINVYKDLVGYTYNKELTKPSINPVIGLATTIKMYYERRTDIK